MPKGRFTGVKWTLSLISDQDSLVDLLKDVLGVVPISEYTATVARKKEFTNLVAAQSQINARTKRGLNRKIRAALDPDLGFSHADLGREQREHITSVRDFLTVWSEIPVKSDLRVTGSARGFWGAVD